MPERQLRLDFTEPPIHHSAEAANATTSRSPTSVADVSVRSLIQRTLFDNESEPAIPGPRTQEEDNAQYDARTPESSASRFTLRFARLLESDADAVVHVPHDGVDGHFVLALAGDSMPTLECRPA